MISRSSLMVPASRTIVHLAGLVGLGLLLWNLRHLPHRSSSTDVSALGYNHEYWSSRHALSGYTNVVFSSDNRTFAGLLAAMRSTIVNTNAPGALRFYLLCGVDEKLILEELVQCMLAHKHPKLLRPLRTVISTYQVLEFNIRDFEPFWEIGYREQSGTSDRSSPNNYARLYLHRLLTRREVVGPLIPEKIVYVDTDVIVLGDIRHLYHMALVNSTAPVAIPKRSRKLGRYAIRFDHPELVLWNSKYKGTAKEITRGLIAFNNGVYVQHLRRWKDQNITQEILYWVEINRKRKLYDFSFNPPFILGLRGRVEALPPEWNVLGFGDHVRSGRKFLTKAKIIHWTGRRKPWLKDGFNKRLWLPYHSPDCFPNNT